jgi:hypothetical protein
MIAKSIFPIVALLTLVWSCQEKNYQNAITDGSYQIAAQDKLTDIIIHDIFSPPVASRIYAYPSIAAFEVAALSDPSLNSLMGQLNGFEKVEFDTTGNVYFPLASLQAYYVVGTALIFSEQMMLDHREKTLKEIKSKGIPNEVFDRSIALGNAVAEHVLAYAKKDRYHESRSYEKYTVSNKPNTWQPTPPAYMEGIEPHWSKIRPFVLDSSSQFKSEPPTPFDTDPKSQFYQEAEYVRHTLANLTDEQRDIAMFWDCNPYKMNIKGHVMYAEKKITPGGHWMGIAAISSKTAGFDWKGTSKALASTSIALFDAFIACWDEKYRSVLIRPETYINKYIDEDWLPLLQTPPFPEYTSGHSVASNAAAETLTAIFGEPFHFVDSTEVAYGLPIREFESFKAAADEAAMSRLYGGIHYMPGIVHGSTKGKNIGQLHLNRIKLGSEMPAGTVAMDGSNR